MKQSFALFSVCCCMVVIIAAALKDNERWKAIYASDPTYRAFGVEFATWTEGSPEAARAWDRCLREAGEQIAAGKPARSCRHF